MATREQETFTTLPLIAALIGLGGTLGAAFLIFAAGRTAISEALEGRLRASADSARWLLASHHEEPPEEVLGRLVRANAIERALIISPDFEIVADTLAGTSVDVEPLRPNLEAALSGKTSVYRPADLGPSNNMVAFVPVRNLEGQIESVLVMETGEPFAYVQSRLSASWVFAGVLALLTAIALGLVAARWRRLELTRAAARAQAARAASMAEMGAMAAHEIRNPLGVIRATVELMRERKGALIDSEDKEALTDILHEVDRLRRLTDDFVELARERPLRVSEVNLDGLLDEAARVTEAAFPDVKIERTGATNVRIRVEAQRILQVFTNLLSNAAEAQKKGKIRLFMEKGSGEVIVSVSDRGPGVPSEVKARLFEPYFTTKAKGTGLGLALAKRIVDRHGGSMVFREHRSGAPGTTFEVHLPTHAVERS